MAELSTLEYKKLLESIDFIRQNPTITNYEIPDEFIKIWLIKDLYNPHCKATKVQTLVFMYIVKLHFQSTEKLEQILNSYRFYQLFYDFQLILAATVHSREAHLPLTPFPIFNISRYRSPDLNDTKELFEQFQYITNHPVKMNASATKDSTDNNHF